MESLRPIVENSDGAKHYSCPGCGKHLLSTKNCRQSGSKTNYCSNCGQKIDWSHEIIETYWHQ